MPETGFSDGLFDVFYCDQGHKEIQAFLSV